MSDRHSSQSKRVTLEDLLRLKKAEQPSPEFWTNFERSMRERQLAALVERKPWWHWFALSYERVGQLRLPLGTAAALAVAFAAVRYLPENESPSAPVARENLAALPLRAAVPVAVSEAPLRALAAVAAPVQVTPAPVSASDARLTEVAVDKPAGAAVQDSEQIPWMNARFGSRGDLAALVPSIQTPPANLLTVGLPETSLSDNSSRTLGFEERGLPVMPAKHTAEVLPTAAAASESRRARLLAALSAASSYAPEPAVPERARREVIRYLSEDGWDRSMSRLEAAGNHLSIKF